jgi:hypothetical protein
MSVKAGQAQWVDYHQPVPEPDSAFVVAEPCRAGVGKPGLRISFEIAHVHANLPVRHAEVSVGRPVLARPGPDLVVHPPVQAL